MITLDFSFKDYLGRIEDGVAVLVSIIADNKAYEGVYWYNKDTIVITVESELRKLLNEPISQHPDYNQFVEKIKTVVLPFDEIYDKLQEYTK